MATPVDVPNIETFWKGVGAYLAYTETIVNASGFGYGDVTFVANDSFSFSSTFAMPDMTAEQTTAFITPLFNTFRSLGINITTPATGVIPYPATVSSFTTASYPGSPADRLFVSRILPRRLWRSQETLDQMLTAFRHAAEAGYRFTTRAYSPSIDRVGYPSNMTDTAPAVNPAMRHMVIHTSIFKQQSVSELLPQSPTVWQAMHDGLKDRVDELRNITPDSGAYFNEPDRLEPNWQQSFFGSNYDRLLEIKKAVDPWSLFWAPTTVGSEAWSVKTSDGLPTQNGPLCRNQVYP
jgi:hypothetical protein